MVDFDKPAVPLGPELVPNATMTQPVDGRAGMRSRWIVAPRPEGWTGFAMSEWELTATGWHDLHPHDELNIVLEGELHVESEGITVVARAGDTVVVRGGHDGRYWAPVHARMMSVYGPNPTGGTSEVIGCWDLE